MGGWGGGDPFTGFIFVDRDEIQESNSIQIKLPTWLPSNFTHIVAIQKVIKRNLRKPADRVKKFVIASPRPTKLTWRGPIIERFIVEAQGMTSLTIEYQTV